MEEEKEKIQRKIRKLRRLDSLAGLLLAGAVGFVAGSAYEAITMNQLNERRNGEEPETSQSIEQLREESQPTPQEMAETAYHLRLMHTYLIKMGRPVPQKLVDLERVARTAGMNVDSLRAGYNF